MKNKVFFLVLLSFLIRGLFAVYYLNFDTHYSKSYGTKPFLSGKSKIDEVVINYDKYNSTAYNIVFSGGMLDKTEHFLYHPPLYSFFLAFSYFFFGYNILSFIIPQILLASFNSALVFILTFRIFRNEKVSFIAALMYALNPYFVLNSVLLLSETLYSFLLLCVFIICSKIAFPPSQKNNFLSGIFLGLTALCRTVVLVFIPFVFIWLISVLRKRAKAIIISSSVIFLAFLLVYGSWLVRNYFTYGRFASSIGYDSALEENSLQLYKQHVEGTLEYGKQRQIFFNWVANNKQLYLKNSAKRFVTFFFKPYSVDDITKRNKIIAFFVFLLIFPLGYLGLFRQIMINNRISWLIFFYCLSTAFLHVMTSISALENMRYRLPIMLCLIPFAANELYLAIKSAKRKFS
ncbi:MAG: glycosyltransferase family 39 protein [Candidatus Omnitrophica bacterium]|nr:glycosyltransferase family 39 protein [Candidatus Omnitrophota bacterium]